MIGILLLDNLLICLELNNTIHKGNLGFKRSKLPIFYF